MKAVKIVLGLVTALVLVFFLTGVVVKEVNYTAEVTINKPINEVFQKFENVDFMKKWLPEVTSITPIQQKPEVVGSTYKMTVNNQGQAMEMIEKITAYTPNEKMTFQFDSDQMTKVDAYKFIANGNTTKMIQNCSVISKNYMASCLFPYFKGTFKNLSISYMNRFKEEVEK